MKTLQEFLDFYRKEYGEDGNCIDAHEEYGICRAWEARQSEIDELKARISELESDNEELRHILRSNQ